MPTDRTRKFTLPGIQDLNKNQDAALALPLEGQHLIIGGPGTGKSVVALLRAKRLTEEKQKYRVLVYNYLLDTSNRHLFGKEADFISETWDKWFRDLYRYVFKTSIPTLEETSSGYRPIDWSSVAHLTASETISPVFDSSYFLVIDEGQDMPPQFYHMLVNWGLENFYVVADQNQQLNPDISSARRDIEDALGIGTKDTLEFKSNYRNTRPIALLAQHFNPGDPASPTPDLPEASPAAQTPELWVYGEPQALGFSEIINRILVLSDRYPKKLIGIITPNNKVREKYILAFNHANPILDNGKPPIQTYSSDNKQELDFGQGGITVINAQSCKGLEFDIVILADIDLHQPKQDVHTLKARFYVMVSRAQEQVILLRTGTVDPVVEELLPKDTTILMRK